MPGSGHLALGRMGRRHSGAWHRGDGAVSAENRSDQSDPKRAGLANRTISHLLMIA